MLRLVAFPWKAPKLLIELIYTVKPDIVVGISVTHGGSLIYYASIMNAMDKGRIIGVDIEIRKPIFWRWTAFRC